MAGRDRARKRKCLERLTWSEDGAVRMIDVDAPTIAQNVDVQTIAIADSKISRCEANLWFHVQQISFERGPHSNAPLVRTRIAVKGAYARRS